MTAKRPLAASELAASLERLVDTFDASTLNPDPLQLVHRYSAPADQEVAGLLAAAFAYGRADQIVKTIGAMLQQMEPSPSQYLMDFEPAEARQRFAAFSYRFQKTNELVMALARISAVLRQYGSPGEAFRSCYREQDRDIGASLERFVALFADASSPAAMQYLFPAPSRGSACKRMNLYLRWMVRRSAPDLGLWTFVDPSRLVIPLDTHIHRITTFLGLNDRKSADWKTARQVTDRLAKIDPADPVRFDFALCRLGILDQCGRKKVRERCAVCLLSNVCRVRLH